MSEHTSESNLNNDPTFKRKLSKREKKELKKAEKIAKAEAKKANGEKENNHGTNGDGVAEKLYTGKTKISDFRKEKKGRQFSNWGQMKLTCQSG